MIIVLLYVFSSVAFPQGLNVNSASIYKAVGSDSQVMRASSFLWVLECGKETLRSFSDFPDALCLERRMAVPVCSIRGCSPSLETVDVIGWQLQLLHKKFFFNL